MSDEILHREFSADLEPGEGRTVDARIVPYGERIPATTVSDGGPRRPYREEWAAGAFDDQLVAGHRLRVLLNVEHEQGIGGIIGKGVSLRSEHDGLHGSFEILRTASGATRRSSSSARGSWTGSRWRPIRRRRSERARASSAASRRTCGTSPSAATRAYKDSVVLAAPRAGRSRWTKSCFPSRSTPRLVERCRRLGHRFAAALPGAPRRNGHPRGIGHLRDRHPPDRANHDSRRNDERNTE